MGNPSPKQGPGRKPWKNQHRKSVVEKSTKQTLREEKGQLLQMLKKKQVLRLSRLKPNTSKSRF